MTTKMAKQCDCICSKTLFSTALHTYIFMFEETQHLQLPKYPLARNKVLEDIGHLFEGDSFSISGVGH